MLIVCVIYLHLLLLGTSVSTELFIQEQCAIKNGPGLSVQQAHFAKHQMQLCIVSKDMINIAYQQNCTLGSIKDLCMLKIAPQPSALQFLCKDMKLAAHDRNLLCKKAAKHVQLKI